MKEGKVPLCNTSGLLTRKKKKLVPAKRPGPRGRCAKSVMWIPHGEHLQCQETVPEWGLHDHARLEGRVPPFSHLSRTLPDIVDALHA